MSDFDSLVGKVYDCAANPELWPNTLEVIRDAMGTAYAMVGFVDTTPTLKQKKPVFTFQHSPWDRDRMLQLVTLAESVPGYEKFLDGSIDESWTQMSQINRNAFNKTHFNKVWAAPQGLVDCLIVPYVSRQHLVGLFSSALHHTQGDVFTPVQCRIAELLSPHLRRAIMINDVVDKGKMALTLCRQVLDSMSSAVFVVGLGRQLMFANAAGEALLNDGGMLSKAGGTLKARRTVGHSLAFDEAIDRALQGDAAAGVSGIGVPLVNVDGERAAAYVLPIAGNDARGCLGPGHCAVFIAQRGEHQPMAVEMLRTMYDMTHAEARVAYLVSRGDGPFDIADGLGISVSTVRTHLKHAFAKSETSDQPSLGALVNQLIPPIAVAQRPSRLH